MNTAPNIAPGRNQKVMLVAGEASSDYHGARVADYLRQISPGIELFGMGGTEFRKAGVETVIDSEHSASVMGFVEVVGNIRNIFAAFNTLLEQARTRRPDVVILIDYPDFNLRLAKKLAALKIPVLYYISPQLWAWRSYRVHTMKKFVRKVATIFPFEENFYHEHGVPAEFVGHPFLDRKSDDFARELFLAKHGLKPDRPVLAILPGSRKSEFSTLIGPMVDAARRLQAIRPGLQVVLPVANSLSRAWVDSQLSSSDITVINGEAFQLLKSSDVAVVASGTATVEAALSGVPFVAVYKMAPLTYKIAKFLVRGVRYFAMANLIAGERVVEELLQDEVSGERISREVERLLGDKQLSLTVKHRLLTACERLRSGTGKPAARRAAEIALELAAADNKLAKRSI